MNDTVSDLLTRIRNAQLAKHRQAYVSVSKMAKAVLEVLKSEGFIEDYTERDGVKKKGQKKAFPLYEVSLKYFSNGEPLMNTLKRVSKPGCRVYSGVEDLEKVNSGLGISIVSTPSGVLSDRVARERNIGGEVLATIG